MLNNIKYFNKKAPMRKFVFILTFILPLVVFSQKEANHWYFGEYAGLDFTTGVPVFDGNGALSSYQSSSSISDPSGNLLFYANSGDIEVLSDTMYGVVCNRYHQIMPNGILRDTCGSQSFQTCIIIPKVGDVNKYYLFTLDPHYSMNKGLRYSIIDMALDGGNGDVSQKGILVLDSMLAGMSATLHSNGNDYWLVVKRIPPGTWTGLVNYYAFKISASGISAPVITPEDPLNNYQGLGTTKFSPNGNLFYNDQGIYNFNKTTGQLSGFRSLGNGSYNCAEFSPNNQVLYATYMGSSAFFVNQFNLTAPILASSITILDSNVNYSACSNKGGIQLGPDGKIYVSLINFDLVSVINSPNSIGFSCNYTPNSVNLSGRSAWWQFPNFPSNYFSNVLGANAVPDITNQPSLSVHPNPCSIETTLQTNINLHNARIIIVDCLGETVRQLNNISGQKIRFSRDNLPNGLYFLQLVERNEIIAVNKLLLID
jgi:hypothetical protein